MTAPIAVVGGAYAEECSFPRSLVYRGSGMRAACILASLGNPTVLHTSIGPTLGGEFEDVAKRKGIELRSTAGSVDIWFRYRHPLGKPDIYPASVPRITAQEDIFADHALVFGMIEGRPKVDAKRVVYDPQDGFRARHYFANGSAADELAIVASWSEGRALTGESAPESVADAILKNPRCVTAIIKCGPQGALVATATSKKWIGAFPTKRVWKIGSGDVFSAAFAHAWLIEHFPILDAAWLASRMVSEYVGTRSETFTPECLRQIREQARTAATRTRETARTIPDATIYIAGPFFSTAEQWLVEEARDAFRDMGFKVFSPIHDVGEGPPNIVAPADLFALQNSALVFALLSGLDPGTIFEVGYARALDIPVVGVAESTELRPLTMLLGSGCAISDDFATGVYSACWHLMGDA